MGGDDHQTRTLLMSLKNTNMLMISRGSDDNIDDEASDITNGHSMIKAFDLSKVGRTPYDFSSQGTVIGWGLRNSVGIAEHPTTGGLFSVENSLDNIQRNGVDFHTDDPGEELNFHGYINGTTAGVQGKNYGYPNCVSVWSPDSVPSASDGLDTGSPIAYGDLSAANSDAECKNNTIAPRLTFQAHWAPLDLLFNSKGTVGYMTSHGSSDRNAPIGYMLLGIPWDGAGGQPLAPANSQNSFVPIMSNQDVTKCPGSCFRPCGLAFDSKGRLWVTSDVTGEIYVITASDGSSVDAINSTSTARGPSGDGGGSNTVSGGSQNGGHTGAAASVGKGVGREALMGFALAVVATLLFF
jgi:glucose/arabinose dehydrogenase